MKEGAILINLSRGFVVDVIALKNALENGKLTGAAVDVYPEEPRKNGDFYTELKGLNNVILTPHVGGSTEEAQKDIAAADNQNRLDIEAARKKDVNSIESRIDAETAELLKTVSTEYEARNRATWALQTSGDLMRKGYAVSDELLEESQVVDAKKFKAKAKTLIKKAGNDAVARQQCQG